MARSVPYRRTMSDAVCWHQREALNATIYILRETGPTGFLLKEEGEGKNFKVFLGDPHSCTCSVFKRERDLCKHLCWLLLKKFRIPETNPLSWQLGLNEREINETLRGLAAQQQSRRQQPPKRLSALERAADGRSLVQQREIDKEDVCPICQEELLSKHLPVTYCKFSCGNSIHIKCMKVWAQHQKSTNQNGEIRCPVCREDFGPFELLRTEMQNSQQGERATEPMDVHIGKMCRNCTLHPIQGHCYRCTQCHNLYLCHQCFNMRVHIEHNFEYRHMRNHRWRQATRPSGRVLPDAVASDMMNRDLSESDYDLLLQLDERQNGVVPSVPDEVLKTFPQFRVKESSPMLAPGAQCRICLRSYEIGQLVRKLPICKHKFHKDCIDGWLLQSRAVCPIDGESVWDPSAPLTSNGTNNNNRMRSAGEGSGEGASSAGLLNLEVPGVKVVLQPSAVRGSEPSRRGSLQRGRLRQLAPLHRGNLHMELSGSAVPHAVDPVDQYRDYRDRDLAGPPGRYYGEEDDDVGGGEEIDAVARETQGVPGMQLLHQAQERHSFLSQRLAHIESLVANGCIEEEDEDVESMDHDVSDRGENRHDVYTADLTYDPLARQGSFGSSNSAPARLNRTRHLGRLRGRGGRLSSGHSSSRLPPRPPLREVPPQSLPSIHVADGRDVQDLYLGHNPRDVPPVPGGIQPPAPSLRTKGRSSLPPRTHHPPRRAPKPSLVLEGNALENLTLRDILN